MTWFTSLFAPKKSYSSTSKRGQALSSTHDAFSLPVSSPGYHGDALNGDAFDDSDSVASPSYTYPPPASPVAYDLVTTPSTSGRQSSLLPLHHTPNSPLNASTYPPLAQTWDRLRNWLAREYPELGDTLNWGILPEDLAQIEMQFGFDLPSAVRESYLTVDGQEPESSAGCSEGLFFGLTLLPLEDVLEEWRFWREVDDDPHSGANARLRESMQSIPPGWIRNEYSSRGWIPLATDKAGNYLGVDVAPGEGGSPGQVIIFGRDYDTKVVLWRGDGPGGWAKWLASFVEELESGEGYELGIGSDGSDGSEDDVGYESYFFDGKGPGGGGSDANAGGLRLVGEYRGWSVLDAWADRSIRRWQESGVLQDETLSSQTRNKVRNSRLGLGVININTGISGAEVPIPVLAEIPEEGAVNEKTPTTSGKVPSIAVTKPPAPRPLELPTEHDIGPYSPEADYGSDYRDGDLEAGQGVSLEDLNGSNRTSLSQSSVTTPKATTYVDADASLVPLPGSPPATRKISSHVPIPPVEDLLADSAPALSATPIEPSPSPSTSKSSDIASVQLPPAEDIEPIPDFSAGIRLVGGGGSSGKVGEEAPEQQESDAPDAPGDTEASLAVSTSPSPAEGTTPKAEKRKSVTQGLKKLGNLGRRTNSTSSVKSAKDTA